MSTLPPEIMDAIVYLLSNEMHTLKNLSLVCSAWLPSTRFYLFGTIRVKLLSIHSLSALAFHSQSTFTGYVKAIEIDGMWKLLEQESAWVDILSIDKSITRLATALPSLKTFRLHNIDFEDVSKHVSEMLVSSITSAFSNVREIELEGIIFVSVSQVMHLISGFRFLKKFTGSNLVWEDPSHEDESRVHSYCVPSTLVELSLDACYKRDIMACLSSHIPFPVIPRLNFGIISPEDCEAYGQYIRRLGPGLFSLSLGFHSLDAGGDAEDFYKACDLCHATELFSIHFSRLVWYWDYRLTSPTPWIAKILSKISSPRFEEISFDIHISNLSQIHSERLPDDYDWSSLDVALDGLPERLPSFRLVTFFIYVVSGSPSLLSAKDTLKSVLPLSSHRRILRFKTFLDRTNEGPLVPSLQLDY
ncbi:hypothetical protein E1B28_005005 [Marasmius oreades]|uniref:F-box domain-containing protein n=1 Tax=Marasmius oreades TaxID=181124 RepID=A0A9P8ADJ8_9AGAR|nr:uncharacterized protein E1B28_005005 [Marasmius oreades]KAG7097679.1 hypothetical protein E1B28_005005 [Marasmius oreades]